MKPKTEQCTAKAKRSAKRCANRVTGGGPCRVHGGNAPQVKAKRMQRIALAEALQADPRRDPHEVLADVGHQADYLMRKARAEIDANRPTARTMTKLLALTDTAGRWAKSNLDAGIAERQTQATEAQAAAIVAVLRRVFDQLELSDRQRELVAVVVPAEIRRLAAPPAIEGRP